MYFCMESKIITENALKCIVNDLINDMSTLDKVMTWCCEATSHFLNQDTRYHMLSTGVTEATFTIWTHLYLVPHICISESG